MRNTEKAFVGLFGAAMLLSGATDYKIVARYPVPGTGSWDYVSVDSPARRGSISHATQVDVMDADKGKPFGPTPDQPGVHGVPIATEFKNGVTHNRREDKGSTIHPPTP